jgi:hypothetical protein
MRNTTTAANATKTLKAQSGQAGTMNQGRPKPPLTNPIFPRSVENQVHLKNTLRLTVGGLQQLVP